MPEAADAIAEGLLDYEQQSHYDLYLVDNGSDLRAPSQYTTVRLPENCQTTGGFLAGLAAAKKSKVDYLAYCFMITSTRWGQNYIGISDALNIMESGPDIVGYSPALTHESTTAWHHMKTRSQSYQEDEVILPFQRDTWMIDNICAFWRADWFDSIGWFDPHLTYAWGIDLETCYKARQQAKRIVLDDFWTVHKTTNIAYQMNRMNMSAEDRAKNARAEMTRVLKSRYGDNWEFKMREEYVTEAMR
jgi:GT2 family glycosyltransferase